MYEMYVMLMIIIHCIFYKNDINKDEPCEIYSLYPFKAAVYPEGFRRQYTNNLGTQTKCPN